MSAFNAAAMVGIETMKIRVAMPEMNCPIMALTSSSASVCLVMGRKRRARLEGADGAQDVVRVGSNLVVAAHRVPAHDPVAIEHDGRRTRDVLAIRPGPGSGGQTSAPQSV